MIIALARYADMMFPQQNVCYLYLCFVPSLSIFYSNLQIDLYHRMRILSGSSNKKVNMVKMKQQKKWMFIVHKFLTTFYPRYFKWLAFSYVPGGSEYITCVWCIMLAKIINSIYYCKSRLLSNIINMTPSKNIPFSLFFVELILKRVNP